MFDVLAVCAPNQFVSLGTLCSMFDVLAVCAPNQFVSFGTLFSMFDVLAVCVPKLLVPVGTLMFHNGYTVCLTFLQNHFQRNPVQEDQVRIN